MEAGSLTTWAGNTECTRKRIATWLTLAAGLLAILSTVSAALYVAHRQSVAEESAASAMTRELLRRADAIGTDAPTSEVALQIIYMAESLGLTVIGEGIETEHRRNSCLSAALDTARAGYMRAPCR